MESDITELEELGAEKVSGVGSPANGTPWLLLKAQDVVANPESPFTESVEADEQEEEMTKAEADDIEDMLTKARFGGFCDGDDCGVCKERFGPLYEQIVEKSKLKMADRKKLPKSAFAIPAKAPASGSYPIHDESHARNALARSSGKPEEAKVRAAVTRRYPKMGKKSTGVPDVSTKVPNDPRPESQWHLRTGQSGVAGPMTTGERQEHSDPSFTPGGESSYVIPEEAKVIDNPPYPKPMDRPGNSEGQSVVTAKESWTIEVIEKENWVSTGKAIAPSDNDGDEPGGPAWQAYDSASCDSVARGLAEAKMAIEAIRTREMTEAVSGDPSEWFDAYQLNCAAEDICSALALVASLAYREAADGKSQSEAMKKSLVSAQSILTDIVGQARTTQSAGFGAQTSKEESIMATVTKEELDAQIAESASKAAKKAVKEFQKAEAKKKAKKAKKKGKKMPAFMEKNANNGGDITEGEMERQVHGTHDANDVGAVGHGVQSQYRNKKSKKNDKAMKAVESKLESVETLLAKMAGRPRTGGPVLDGQSRGAFPASEGRTTEAVAKGADDEISRLEKSLSDSNDAVYRDQISRELTLARLRKGHEDGLI